MKVLFITGDDYAAKDFEFRASGVSVKEIIEDPLSYDSDSIYDMDIIEFGEVDPKFVDFIRDRIQDYDLSKSTNFYFENETIKGDLL